MKYANFFILFDHLISEEENQDMGRKQFLAIF